jgi:hypothetical protein
LDPSFAPSSRSSLETLSSSLEESLGWPLALQTSSSQSAQQVAQNLTPVTPGPPFALHLEQLQLETVALWQYVPPHVFRALQYERLVKVAGLGDYKLIDNLILEILAELRVVQKRKRKVRLLVEEVECQDAIMGQLDIIWARCILKSLELLDEVLQQEYNVLQELAGVPQYLTKSEQGEVAWDL